MFPSLVPKSAIFNKNGSERLGVKMKKKSIVKTSISVLAIASMALSFNVTSENILHMNPIPSVCAAEVQEETVTVNGITWVYEKGNAYDADLQLVQAIKNIRPENKETLPSEVEIPDKIDGLGVMSIAENAFSKTKIKKVVIPDSVSVIGRSAFADCEQLTDIGLPKELKSVYAHAFENCKAIKEVCVKDAYDYAFSGCTNLKKVTFTLGSYTTTVDIRSHAFENCSALQDITFAEKTTKINIASYVFAGCSSLKKWSVPRAMLNISYYGFANCTNLEEFDFSKKTYVQYGAFQNCTALSELTFKASTTLGLGAFDKCTNLKTVTFEDNAYQSYSAKAQSVFSNCTALQQITFNGKESDIEIEEGKIGAQQINVTRAYEKLNREVPKEKEMPAGTDVLDYSVLFDGNGGLVESLTNKTEKIYQAGDEIKSFPTVVRKGYAFTGWYDEAKDGTKVAEASILKNGKNQTVYAHWNKVTVEKGKIKKVAKKGKTVSVLIQSQAGVDGYEVVCATNKNFTSSKKKIVKAANASFSLSGTGKKYYVKVRAYKKDSAGNKVYGSYSSISQIQSK